MILGSTLAACPCARPTPAINAVTSGSALAIVRMPECGQLTSVRVTSEWDRTPKAVLLWRCPAANAGCRLRGNRRRRVAARAALGGALPAPRQALVPDR